MIEVWIANPGTDKRAVELIDAPVLHRLCEIVMWRWPFYHWYNRLSQYHAEGVMVKYPKVTIPISAEQELAIKRDLWKEVDVP